MDYNNMKSGLIIYYIVTIFISLILLTVFFQNPIVSTFGFIIILLVTLSIYLKPANLSLPKGRQKRLQRSIELANYREVSPRYTSYR